MVYIKKKHRPYLQQNYIYFSNGVHLMEERHDKISKMPQIVI